VSRVRPNTRKAAVALAALLVWLLVGAATAQFSAAAVKKKHSAAQAGTHAGTGAKAHSTTHGRSASSSTRSHSAFPSARGRATTTSRANYAAPHAHIVQRETVIEEISERLKEPAPHAISYLASLEGFYSQLAAYEQARRTGIGAGAGTGTEAGPLPTVRVLQWGDSHTAADMFTGEARRAFQSEFGDGGVGYLYAGHPFPGYHILGSTASQSSGWATAGNKFQQLTDGEALGMGGIRISTERAGETVTLDTPCSTLDLQYLVQPGGGSLSFTDNGGNPTIIQTGSGTSVATGLSAPAYEPVPSAGTLHYTCTPGEHHFALTTQDSAPVTLFGWVATQPGVTWECLGINGAVAPLILRWDQNLFTNYLRANQPALVVLAYGTNEAASPSFDEATYRQSLVSILTAIRQVAPDASVMFVGPPDRSTSAGYGRRRAWRTFTGTEAVIAVQREVCRQLGCAYWDQRQRMGGLGAMQRWVYAGWAQPDHTHFTGDGYRALADALVSDLMAGYQAYKERHSAPTVSALQGENNGIAHSRP
jgi:lysophospholipase L1-like esterase